MFKEILELAKFEMKKKGNVGHAQVWAILGIVFAVVGAVIVLSVLKTESVIHLLFNWSVLDGINPTLGTIMPFLMLLFFLVVVVAVIGLVVIKIRR